MPKQLRNTFKPHSSLFTKIKTKTISVGEKKRLSGDINIFQNVYQINVVKYFLFTYLYLTVHHNTCYHSIVILYLG
jgi:hypothetical protein